MTDLERQLDCIGPLGPFPLPASEVVEVGRWPVVIEDGQICECEDLDCEQPRHAYSYRKPETGDQ